MPLLDELQKYAYPFNDVEELEQLKKKDQITMLFECRYCHANFEWTVPLETKIEKWRCPICKMANAMYV